MIKKKMEKPKYNLFDTVIYCTEDEGGGYRVGRIESIFEDGVGWNYVFHDRSNCHERSIREKINK
jgi:hypothetical protein